MPSELTAASASEERGIDPSYCNGQKNSAAGCVTDAATHPCFVDSRVVTAAVAGGGEEASVTLDSRLRPRIAACCPFAASATICVI